MRISIPVGTGTQIQHLIFVSSSCKGKCSFLSRPGSFGNSTVVPAEEKSESPVYTYGIADAVIESS